MEQSLINGLWGHYQHDVIALASILIARFEMKSINQVRWRKGNGNQKDFKLLKTWNPNFGTYIKSNSVVFKKCIEEIYAKIFDGAKFPFEQEIYKKGDITVEKPSHIRI